MVNKVLLKQLLRNWNKQKSIIIAVDFDDTICIHHINATKQCENTIKILRDAQEILKERCKIIIYTARKNTIENYDHIYKYCEDIGIKIIEINQNVIDWHEGSKLFYNILLDDRSGLNEAIETLDKFLDLVDNKETNDPKYLNIPNICFSLTDKEDPREEEFKKQRIENGFDESETWSLDSTITKFIVPRLEKFIEVVPNHPNNMNMDEWKNILNKILTAFKLIKKDHYGMTLEEEMEMEKGLKLFSEHFTDLWW